MSSMGVKEREKEEKDLIRLKEEVEEVPKKPNEIFPDFKGLKFMYILPLNDELKREWLEEWAQFIMEWARFHEKFLIDVEDLLSSEAFSSGDVSLGMREVRALFEYLVEKGMAEWYGKGKRQIILYWLSLEKVLEDIFRWAIETGRVEIDVYTLLNSEEPWSNLPPEKLYTILCMMVKKKRARWLNRKKSIIEINLHSFHT
ncbi:MAG: hypothetical protein J7L50_01370 [Candidatus Odinarchaeota archaeon]|nr:hypothetical protein [Candidatus Odinarchaeota archaeon]